MRIGILGSGLMGAKLGTIFAQAGHQVVFSYSHDPRKLQALARKAGKNARAGTPADAVKGADAVLLAVHWSRVDDVLKQAGSLAGKTVVSCTLPMNHDDTRLVVGLTTSGAETIARKRRKAHVVCAFSTAPSELFFPLFKRRRSKTRPTLVYCGNNAAAKRKAATLIRAVGFEPIDVGDLSMARHIEPFTLLLAELAYDGSGSQALSYRFTRLKR
jgi:predicted dinucleotide-binding enzyme